MLNRRLAVLLCAAGAALGEGCYLSHERENVGGDLPDSPSCVQVSEPDDPILVFESTSSPEVETGAGSENIEVASFRVRNLIEEDVAIGVFTVALISHNANSAIYDLQLTWDGREVMDPVTPSFGETSVRLMDMRNVGAGSEHEYHLLASFSPQASGRYEITIGEDCRLTSYSQYVDSPEIIPAERLGGNAPITVIVGITP